VICRIVPWIDTAQRLLVTDGVITDRSVQLAHLRFPLLVQSKQVIQSPVVDTTPLILLNVGASHGVGFSRACLAVCKYAHIVACRSTTSWEITWQGRLRKWGLGFGFRLAIVQMMEL